MRDTIVPFFASLFLIAGALLFSDVYRTSPYIERAYRKLTQLHLGSNLRK